MEVVRHRSLQKAVTRMAAGLAVALGLLFVTAPGFKAADSLPSQISDETFWKMIEDFSEDGGSFTSENFSSIK